MNNITLQQISEYSKKHRRRKRWQSVVTAMAAVVVFVTTYALILPAITMDNDTSCGLDEHIHMDECFAPSDEDVKILSCDLAEHTHHEIACYADRSADVETRSDWEATLEDVNLLGELHRDVLFVAKSQLDYCESNKNLILNDDGKLSGYTRYGEWYGDPYGEWSAMFAAFCLNYAGVANMPFDSDINGWISLLSEEKYDFYRTAGDHVPTYGEVIFLDKDKDGAPDKVGIIAEVVPDIEGKGAKIKVIEGDSSNKVQYVIYEYNSEMIIGYSILPDGLYKDKTVTAEIFTDSSYGSVLNENNTVITVSGVMPKDGYVYAYPVEDEDESTLCAYDITVFDGDGNVFQPLGGDSLKVSIQSDVLKEEAIGEGYHAEAFHIPEDGEPQRMSAKYIESGIEFSAEHFSTYAVRAANTTSVKNKEELASAINNGRQYIEITSSFDVGNSFTITNGKNITIDLNGNTLKYTGGSAMFRVGDWDSSGTLTIRDSKQPDETVTMVNSEKPSYGNLATLSVSSRNNNATLTYYVTKTDITNVQTGATVETLYKHTITTAGAIVGNGQPIVSVGKGVFTLESGMLRSGTGRAIHQENKESTTNIKGGYICGFSKTNSDFGGAIYASNGTVNISGSAVVAANKAKCGGAIVLNGSNAKLNISGGVISGNTATLPNEVEGNNGGGIYVNHGTVTMSDGYITNNTATGSNYYDGGGGVFLFDSDSKFEISGGYVTANKANGGGGLKTKNEYYATFKMSGGFFSGNLATACEGAGIALELNSRGELSGGYITNNILEKTEHWGGGGFFCADKAEVYMYNLLVTNNTAGGFGGGVAGCPTGELTLYVDSGCAVFGNVDVISGEVNWVSGGTKDGQDFQKCKEVFQSNGHEDFFCANQSTIFGTMLGKGSAEWQGSADGIPITAGKGDIVTANNVMGLQSHASEEDKQNAMAVAKLYINGNHSDTHGGGIMCNGRLIIGEAVDFTVPTLVQIQANKVLYQGGTNKELPLDDYNFTFKLVKDYLNGEVLETVKCNSKGYLSFHNGLKFSENGTYVYYIMEVPDEKTNTILFDNSIYEVTIAVKRDNGTEFNGKTKYTYQITNMSIDKSTDGGKTWSSIYQNSQAQSGSVTVALVRGSAFVNRTMEFTKLTVKKEWDGGTGADSVTVILKQDGVKYAEVNLSAANKWTYTWNNLPAGHQYTVEEVSVFGYTPSYNVVPGNIVSAQKQLEYGLYWIPATSIQKDKQYIIVSYDGKKALCVTSAHTDSAFTSEDTTDVSAQLTQMTLNGTKYNFWMSNTTLKKGAIFTPQDRNQNSESYRNGGLALKSDIGNSWLLAQDAGGNYLKSTNSVAWSSLVVCENGYLKINNEFDGTPNNLRTVIFDSENGKFNTVGNDSPSNAAILLTQVSGNPTVTETFVEDVTVVITNTGAPGYKLPDTGGGGTFMYIAAGMALMTLGAYLAYKKLKGGKEDSASF